MTACSRHFAGPDDESFHFHNRWRSIIKKSSIIALASGFVWYFCLVGVLLVVSKIR